MSIKKQPKTALTYFIFYKKKKVWIGKQNTAKLHHVIKKIHVICIAQLFRGQFGLDLKKETFNSQTIMLVTIY